MSQTYTRTRSSIKYPIRKLYKIMFQVRDKVITPYEYIENAIEIEFINGEDNSFMPNNKIRIWAEEGKLEILELT